MARDANENANANANANENANANANANTKKRVLIVGAGAAGMSCAHHLAEHPGKFDVTVVEAADYCGGQAFSIPIDKRKHGASWLNQGVQGGSYIFHHTMTMFARQGHAANPVELQVSFGKDDHFWTNMYPTKLLAKHQAEVRRFVRMLAFLRWFELVFALVPIKVLMRLFCFSREFATTVALPMVALFLGTGNYTPDVPAVMLERLCTSPTYGMWYPPDRESVASNQPPMVVFPNFSRFYDDWRRDLLKRGVRVRLSTELTRVVSRDKTGVTVKTIKRAPAPDGHSPSSAWAAEDAATKGAATNADAGTQETTEHYDELVLCCLADTAKRLLGDTATFRERHILGAAKFSDDLTITHHDSGYITKHYEVAFNSTQAVTHLTPDGADHTDRVGRAAAPGGFRPMYLIKPYVGNAARLEMCFDCTHYQAQFPPQVETLDSHVFQTIFLNAARDATEKLWTDGEIDASKVIRRDWWHQLCHVWTHYVLVVPWLWLLQRRRRTRFAGSWTVVNAHEVAVLSGVAAAVDLGAEYPADLERDPWALRCFRLYYLLVYGRWYRRRVDPKGPGEDWASGLYGGVYKGPGVVDTERQMWRDERDREGGK